MSHVSCQLDELLHINAVRSNSPDINQRQIRCFSIRGVTETELPEAVLERMQTSPLLSSPLSSDYETDNENENENESDMSSDMSSMSTATTPVSSDPSPRPAMSVLPSGSLSEAERVLLLTIPYFEGDYLPYVCEDLLKEMYQESIKPKTSRNVGVGLACDCRPSLTCRPYRPRRRTRRSCASGFSRTTSSSCRLSFCASTRSRCWRILRVS